MLFDVMSGTRVLVGLVFLLSFLLHETASAAETLAVRYQEGVSHGFLVLRTQDGKSIADGDSTQEAHGDRVTSGMRFRFKDGSIYAETTVFSQHRTFKLVSDHVLQKGPTFKRPMETDIDATSGYVKVRYTEVKSLGSLQREAAEWHNRQVSQGETKPPETG